MKDKVTLYPEWKQAVASFLTTDPKPGDVVTRTQLEAWLSMVRPATGTYDEIRSYELRFLKFRDRWAEELMRKYEIQFSEKDLDLNGWRVLAPHEIASFTRRQSTRDLKRALRKQRDRLAFTDLTALSPAQQREHAETLIRSSWKLRALHDAEKKPVEFPSPPKALPRQ